MPLVQHETLQLLRLRPVHVLLVQQLPYGHKPEFHLKLVGAVNGLGPFLLDLSEIDPRQLCPDGGVTAESARLRLE